MVSSWVQQWAKGLVGVALLSVLCILCAQPVQAAASPQWQLTGETADGLAQQYVDLNSIQGRGRREENQWVVDSYFTEHKTNEDVRADYVTLYDCDRHRYKDINGEGLPTGTWGDAMADPLNLATMDFVCQHVAK